MSVEHEAKLARIRAEIAVCGEGRSDVLHVLVLYGPAEKAPGPVGKSANVMRQWAMRAAASTTWKDLDLRRLPNAPTCADDCWVRKIFWARFRRLWNPRGRYGYGDGYGDGTVYKLYDAYRTEVCAAAMRAILEPGGAANSEGGAQMAWNRLHRHERIQLLWGSSRRFNHRNLLPTRRFLDDVYRQFPPLERTAAAVKTD